MARTLVCMPYPALGPEHRKAVKSPSAVLFELLSDMQNHGIHCSLDGYVCCSGLVNWYKTNTILSSYIELLVYLQKKEHGMVEKCLPGMRNVMYCTLV